MGEFERRKILENLIEESIQQWLSYNKAKLTQLKTVKSLAEEIVNIIEK